MTKMYLKSECEFKNNRIVCGNEIVAIDRKVFGMLDNLEETLQMAKYMLDQPAPQDAPNMKGFERKTAKKAPTIVKPATPFTDMKILHAMKMMEEADKMTTVNGINETLEHFKPVFDFVNEDYIVECPEGTTDPFDLVMLGNPLELKETDIMNAVVTITNADLHAKGEPTLNNIKKVDDEVPAFIRDCCCETECHYCGEEPETEQAEEE